MSALYLNGFTLTFSSDEFKGYVRAMADNKELKSLRNQLKDSWFLQWQNGICCLLRLQPRCLRRGVG